MNYKNVTHISFDLWNTLIKPNTEYSTRRNKLICEHFCISFDAAKNEYTKCKTYLDDISENYGIQFSSYRCWKLLENTICTNKSGIENLINDCNNLFLEYKPIFNERLFDKIYKLKEKGYELSIKSNTNFISGTVLDKCLCFDDLFNFRHYSDEYLMSKPSTEFFKLTEHDNVFGNKILHIGDNFICDSACKNIGWDFKLVSSPDDLLTFLDTEDLYNA